MFHRPNREREFGRSTHFRIRGLTTEERVLVNPVLGEWVRYDVVEVTAFDPHTGAVVVRHCEPVIQCYMGDVIPDGQALAFCGECGRPTCRYHSVIDPFCGQIVCLHDSRLVTWGGLSLRVCPQCYRAMRESPFQRVLRRIFGPRDGS